MGTNRSPSLLESLLPASSRVLFISTFTCVDGSVIFFNGHYDAPSPICHLLHHFPSRQKKCVTSRPTLAIANTTTLFNRCNQTDANLRWSIIQCSFYLLLLSTVGHRCMSVDVSPMWKLSWLITWAEFFVFSQDMLFPSVCLYNFPFYCARERIVIVRTRIGIHSPIRIDFESHVTRMNHVVRPRKLSKKRCNIILLSKFKCFGAVIFSHYRRVAMKERFSNYDYSML